LATLLIDRCTLRVIRRGGWSWGPDPKRLLEEAVGFLPDLLARALEGCFDDVEDRTYEAPLCIRVRLSHADFEQAFPRETRFAESPTRPHIDALEKRIETAMLRALGISKKDAADPPPSEVIRRERFREQPLTKLSFPREAGAFQSFLMARYAEGTLATFLATLTAPELEVWHGAIRKRLVADISTPNTRELSGELERAVQEHRAPAVLERAAFLRRRVLAAAEVAAKRGMCLDDSALWETPDALLPDNATLPGSLRISLNSEAAESDPGRDLNFSASIVPGHPQQAAIAQSEPRAIGAAVNTKWSTQVFSALPFLLLGPMERMGHLSMLAAILEAAHLENGAAFFAAALAHKVMQPPERGWRRSPAAQHAAAVFAGLTEAPPESAIAEFSRQIVPHLGPLDRSLAAGVIAGRSADAPILLSRADSAAASGFLLVDTQGCFPIGWFSEAAAAVKALQTIAPRVVLVNQNAAGPHILQQLDRAQISFVTDVFPTRNEPWQPILRGTSRLGWTNHSAPGEQFLQHGAQELGPASEDANILWKELGVDRVGLPTATRSEVESTLFRLASVTLGILAWKLWRARGRTSPQLALERLGDLGAHVDFHDDTVTVRVPLGGRHSELLQSGLLARVGDVPWLGRRKVEFGWG
jgi:hypothetical protein